MEKLNLTSPDLVQKNIEAIAAAFPNVITEVRDEQGNLQRAVDFDLLKQELSAALVEGDKERYQLTWPGKRQAILQANAPINKTLRPVREDSMEWDTTQNLYIEGDNLEVLKLLQESYLNKVKCIYIDPPYNTGKDFIYKDDFRQSTAEYLQDSGQVDEEGNRLFQNNESNGRFHSDWLTMMYPRLKLARNLLRDDGVMFISIDDNEVHNLRKICDELCGAGNFIGTIAVQINPRGRNLDKFIATTHETVVIVAKNAGNYDAMSGIEKTGKMLEEYDREDENGKYRLIGLRNRNQAFNPNTRPNLFFPLFVDPSTGRVSSEKNLIHTDVVYPETAEGIQTCWTWGKEKIDKQSQLLLAEKLGEDWRVFRKDYLIDSTGNTAVTLIKSVWVDKEVNNDYGRKAVKELFGSALMDFPKPVDLITKLAKTQCSDAIILDFFSGSATTAHAVMQLNAEDGGNRQYIMVQLPEITDEDSEAYKAGYKNICAIGKERIRRAATKIQEETGADIDYGFRVFRVDSSNMKDVYRNPQELNQDMFSELSDNIKDDRTGEDLLIQVMLAFGLSLSLPMQTREVAGCPVYYVAENSLVACFADQLPEELVRQIAGEKPLQVVFRDSSFSSDAARINVEEIFKAISPATKIKVL